MIAQVPNWPKWLRDLRSTAIVRPLRDDPRTGKSRNPLGLDSASARRIIDYGQADFDSPYGEYSPDDRVSLYAYWNQKLHLDELITAFSQLYPEKKSKDLIVLDIGCGPFTGGLALLAWLGGHAKMDYIGVDRAESMRNLGKRLSESALIQGDFDTAWYSDTSLVLWEQPTSWRDTLVIISYLFASRSVQIDRLSSDLIQLINRIGYGAVTVLYMNSRRESANLPMTPFEQTLEKAGFDIKESLQVGTMQRTNKAKPHTFKFALFRRPPRSKMEL